MIAIELVAKAASLKKLLGDIVQLGEYIAVASLEGNFRRDFMTSQYSKKLIY